MPSDGGWLQQALSSFLGENFGPEIIFPEVSILSCKIMPSKRNFLPSGSVHVVSALVLVLILHIVQVLLVNV